MVMVSLVSLLHLTLSVMDEEDMAIKGKENKNINIKGVLGGCSHRRGWKSR